MTVMTDINVPSPARLTQPLAIHASAPGITHDTQCALRLDVRPIQRGGATTLSIRSLRTPICQSNFR